MFHFKDKRTKICFIGMMISLLVLFYMFFATDGMTGDKEFSQYTQSDWAIAIVPLSIMAVSAISTLVFSLIILIPIMRMYPAISDYVKNKKFDDIDPETEIIIFDHNEFKRACCRTEAENGIWISVKEYDIKVREWVVLEEGRRIEKADDLPVILLQDYEYDEIKVYYSDKEA